MLKIASGRFASFLEKLELKKADDYIKSVIPNAKYYLDYELGALILEPTESDEDMDNRTVINGTAYKGTFTNKYENLVKLRNSQKKYEQLTLF